MLTIAPRKVYKKRLCANTAPSKERILKYTWLWDQGNTYLTTVCCDGLPVTKELEQRILEVDRNTVIINTNSSLLIMER